MSRQDSDLNVALRMLAEAAPREAPPRVEAALRSAFRRYRSARRLRTGMVVAIAAGATAAALAVFAWTLPAAAGPPARVTGRTVPPPRVAWVNPAAIQKAQHARPWSVHQPARTPMTASTATDFVPLPYGDDALVGENARIVRVELPGSALRLAGFSIAQERVNERFQADVVLGADGLAHAVRFVQ